MSTFVLRSVPCPRCGVRVERPVASSVNAGRSPEYREQILAGTFQVEECAGCGQPVTAISPFVYIDFGRQQFIAVHPSAVEERWSIFEDEALAVYRRNIGAEAPPVARRFDRNMQVRVVFGLGSLREKLLLFDRAIDEVAIEAAKLALWVGHCSRQHPLGRATRPRLEQVDDRELRFRLAGGSMVDIDRGDLEEWAADDVTAERLGRLFDGRAYRDLWRLAAA